MTLTCHLRLLQILSKKDPSIFVICNRCFIPCQAVSNRLDITFLPKQFESIPKLEKVLVSRRILSKKVVIMPKGKLPKLKGSLCNIPVNKVYDNCQSLPRQADSNDLLIVKLKREPVRPMFVEQFLKYLKNHNYLYSDIEINMDNLPLGLLDLNNSLNND